MSKSSNKFEVWVSRILRLVCAVALLVGCTGAVLAQSTNSQLSGVVEDASKAVVPDAEVVATNTNTGIEYKSKTNDSGLYILPEMLPGPYKITVTKQGFAPFEKGGLILRTSDKVTANFELRVAVAGQTVTVQEDFVPLMVSTDQTSNSTTLDNKMITELPQLNRSTLQLTGVTPAVQGQGPLSDNIASLGTSGYLVGNHGTSYSVAGGQVNGTTISVDGNLVQDQEYNTPNRSIPTPDTIGEFRVESGVLTADHGRYSGGIISMNTQSGTNAFHGRLFEYFRNQAMNANDWNNNANDVPIQSFHQNNYGASVGGPVIIPKVYNGKNKTFFFFGWEGERFSQGLVTKSSVPTADNLNGDFSKTITSFENGEPVYAKIYDPFNSYLLNGNRIRPEFPNDTIPAAGQCVPVPAPAPAGRCFTTMSTLFSHYLPLYPAANHAPDLNSTISTTIGCLSAPPGPAIVSFFVWITT